jgi:hypothetical protein
MNNPANIIRHSTFDLDAKYPFLAMKPPLIPDIALTSKSTSKSTRTGSSEYFHGPSEECLFSKRRRVSPCFEFNILLNGTHKDGPM